MTTIRLFLVGTILGLGCDAPSNADLPCYGVANGLTGCACMQSVFCVDPDDECRGGYCVQDVTADVPVAQ